MKLYHASASPFARACLTAALELGLGDRLEIVPTSVAPTRPNRDYERTNPLRKIPALETDDGEVVYDSAVIIAYLDHVAGGDKLVPADKPARFRVLTDYALAQGMMDAAVLLRYETALRPEEHRWPDWIADQSDKIASGLMHFEQRPERLREPVTSAQIGLGCLLGYLDFRFEGMGWADRCPNIEEWYSAFSGRDSMLRTEPS